MSLHTIHVHEELREVRKWGTYGKSGREELRYILIKDLSNKHLKSIITHLELRLEDGGYSRIVDLTLSFMKDELEYREIRKINIVEPYTKEDLKYFKFFH